MTGSNCSIVGCNTTRRHKDISQFRCPNPKLHPQWSKEFLAVVTSGRVIDAKFKTQIEINNVYVCEKHFKEDVWRYARSTQLKEGMVPTLALPVKSHANQSEPRSTSAISKREDFQHSQQMEVSNAPPKPCYAGYQALRTKKLKLSIGWNVIDYIDFAEAKYNEPQSQFLASTSWNSKKQSI
eukprot:TCONS_00022595-protein